MSATSPRFITATSLFDGHDVSINLIRRLLQSQGAEVIHLGHNRSAEEVVTATLQEDAQAVALSSYQGGHNEYFRYIRQLLNERGGASICIFGGGGGVFTKEEITALHQKGITKIYTPEDGAKLGLEGMIRDMLSRLPKKNPSSSLVSIAKKIQEKKQKGGHLPSNSTDLSDLSDRSTLSDISALSDLSDHEIAQIITAIEEKEPLPFEFKKGKMQRKNPTPVLGITGTGGAGKSSLIDELLLRWHLYYPEKKMALISVDPSRKKQGALLGDRLRLSSIFHGCFYVRSLATRDSSRELSPQTAQVLEFMKSLHRWDLILLETSGIGQASNAVTEVSDACVYVMTPEFGAPTQLEKIEMLASADFIVLNKSEKIGAEDAFKAICKQYLRNHWDSGGNPSSSSTKPLPVYSCSASRFGNLGVHRLFQALCDHFHFPLGPIEHLCQKREQKTQQNQQAHPTHQPHQKKEPPSSKEHHLIPPERQFYLQEIAQACRKYNTKTDSLVARLEDYEALCKTSQIISSPTKAELVAPLKKKQKEFEEELEREEAFKCIKEHDQRVQAYREGSIAYGEKKVSSQYKSLSGTALPHVALPSKAYGSLSQKYRFLREQNLPGFFPFGAGAFPFKKKGEEPKRMFAGEGGPDHTNRRFHFLCEGEDFHRLSTAFDSVTLYGEDPDTRPDIFGKVGESGVSIATLEDMERLYAGFDLTDPCTSVSMTINGPAPILLAMFMNTALRQKIRSRHGRQNEKHSEKHSERPNGEHDRNHNGKCDGKHDGKRDGREDGKEEWKEEWSKSWSEEEKIKLMREVRGTVQADILKEDQAQNTCIFSLDFALRMMGDVQAYFTQHKIRKYYTVSVSGYHIAEMGANPITQLTFTLANGFTLVEYYLGRGMDIDSICANMSFFFSNGMDPEYSVIGQVGRKIWAIACKERYGANLSSQRLKYHIQTSGRSLHAQEMTFNDIRTTLQALLAISDSCNSLHTNAYDEAFTTPTEGSVRQAMAIQLILQREFGLSQSVNPLQGSFLREELLEKVEEAVLQEFESLSRRGGVLGAMELMYQRNKIQEESLLYETLKSSGKLPIIGVNTFTKTGKDGSKVAGTSKVAGKRDSMGKEKNHDGVKIELSRSSDEEKMKQVERCRAFKNKNKDKSPIALAQLQRVAAEGGNVFYELMSTVQYCSLGQITHALYEVGGRYRRNR